MAVLIDDLDRVLFTGDRDAVAQRLTDAGKDELVSLAKRGDRSGLRADHADFHGRGAARDDWNIQGEAITLAPAAAES